MKRLALLLLVAIAPTLDAGTIRNDDSCDISTMPAATLLLPYFEVDILAPAQTAQTTLFTIVNTSPTPQIARVTLWSDWAFPVLAFDLYLTGYDAQAVNLRDVLVRGAITATTNTASPGSRSLAANPRFLADAAAACAAPVPQLPPGILFDVQSGLTTGAIANCGENRIGGVHTNATGYATIDVVATCSARPATDPAFLGELLYDNVLTGDWQLVNPDPAIGNYAAGAPLVHIRAVPAGGNAGELVPTNLPYTFYDRFRRGVPRATDRRQPLPSSFAVRYIQGGPNGFLTNVLFWREGFTGADASCGDIRQNSRIDYPGVVRFDERENPSVSSSYCPFPPTCPPPTFGSPAVLRAASVSTTHFPPMTSGDFAGWFALSLDNGGSPSYSVAPGRDFQPDVRFWRGPRPSQNWIMPMFFAEGRFSAAFDAITLANGCSRPARAEYLDVYRIGPGANVTP